MPFPQFALVMRASPDDHARSGLNGRLERANGDVLGRVCRYEEYILRMNSYIRRLAFENFAEIDGYLFTGPHSTVSSAKKPGMAWRSCFRDSAGKSKRLKSRQTLLSLQHEATRLVHFSYHINQLRFG